MGKIQEEIKITKGNKIVFNILAIISIILFCIAISPKTMQNDTYYSVKIGEDILTYGVDGKDHYSWNENLSYDYPHWLYDVMMYQIYHFGGWEGIYISTIIFASILGLLMYGVTAKLSKNHLLAFLFTAIALFFMKSYIAARAQLVTYILFILTIFFIEMFLRGRSKNKSRPNWIYAIGLILISLLIANLHVAVWPFFFVLFLPYIAEWIACVICDADIILRLKKLHIILKSKTYKVLGLLHKKELEEKLAKWQEEKDKIDENIKFAKEARKENRKNPYKIKIIRNANVKYLILVMVICAGMGLISPMKNVPYTYLVKTMQGDTTKNINEHLPVTLIDQKELLAIMLVSIACLMLTRVKIRLKDLLLLGGLFLLSLMSRRHMALLAVIGIVPIARIAVAFIQEYKCENDLKKIFKESSGFYGFTIILCVVIIISARTLQPKLKNSFVDENSYPVKASDYILQNLDLKNMRIYNEYNYGSYMLFRGIPVFIDSRADLYTPEFNPGCTVFDDFLNISNIGTYYENKFDEYKITHVICFKNAKLNMFLSRNSEYKELYSDNKFVIYERDAN